MAKNRKTQGEAIRFGSAARAFLLCVFLGGSAIGYVWQQQQIMRLNQRKTSLEHALHDLQVQNRRKNDQYESQLLPKALEERVRRMNLGLVPHNPAQVVRLTEPSAEPPTPLQAERQLAASPRLSAQNVP
jgi:hypothetical protein